MWLRAIIAFAVAFAVVGMATAGWYNWVKTGSIFLTGYGEQTRGTDFGLKPYIGLFGTLFSSGFGLFTFNPITILGVFSLLILAIGRRVEAVVFGTIILGVAINFLAVLFDFNVGWLDLWDHHASLTQIEFDPHFSTIGAHLRLLGGFLSNGSKLDPYIYYKLGIPSLILFIALFVAFTALAVRTALLQEGTGEQEGSLHMHFSHPTTSPVTAMD